MGPWEERDSKYLGATSMTPLAGSEARVPSRYPSSTTLAPTAVYLLPSRYLVVEQAKALTSLG